MTNTAPRPLRGVDLVLTAACNLKCTYCYQNSKQGSVMEWGILQAAVDRLLRSERRELQINFYGGEPLLQIGQIRRAVEYVEAHRRPATKVRYVLLTNGLLLDEEVAAFVSTHGIETQISFDGVPAAQDLRAPRTFAVLDELLDRLRELRRPFFDHSVSVGVTLTVDNLPHLADSFEYFLDKGVRGIGVMPLVTEEPRWNRECFIELDRQFSRICRSSSEHYRETKQVPFTWFDTRGGTSPRARDDAICNAARGNTLAVDVDGSTYGCVLFCGSYQRLPAGLLERNLPRLGVGCVTDPELSRRRAAYPEAARATGLFHDRNEKYSGYFRCRDCRHLPRCAICPASIGLVAGSGDPHRVPDMQCAFNAVALTWRDRFVAGQASLIPASRRPRTVTA